MIPLKANVPAWRLAYATLAVAAACAVAFALLLDRAALLWPTVFLVGNMVAIWTFGSGVEPLIGHLRTLALLAGRGRRRGGAQRAAGRSRPGLGGGQRGARPGRAGDAVRAAPRARVIMFSAVPLFGGVIEVPLAVVAVAWLGLEALAVAMW